MTTKIRVFFALNPSLEFKQSLWQQLAPFRENHANQVRWSPPRNYHITVKYLGMMPAQELYNLLDFVASEISCCHAPSIECEKIIPFPNQDKPRVIASLIKPQAELQQLFKRIEHQLSHNGYREENRPYLPHLSVARVRNFNCPDFKPVPITNCGEIASHLTLFQSISTKKGVLYVPLARLPLQSPATSATLYP